MELNRIGNFTILKVIQTGPHQPDARYGASWEYISHVCHLCQLAGLYSKMNCSNLLMNSGSLE